MKGGKKIAGRVQAGEAQEMPGFFERLHTKESKTLAEGRRITPDLSNRTVRKIIGELSERCGEEEEKVKKQPAYKKAEEETGDKTRAYCVAKAAGILEEIKTKLESHPKYEETPVMKEMVGLIKGVPEADKSSIGALREKFIALGRKLIDIEPRKLGVPERAEVANVNGLIQNGARILYLPESDAFSFFGTIAKSNGFEGIQIIERGDEPVSVGPIETLGNFLLISKDAMDRLEGFGRGSIEVSIVGFDVFCKIFKNLSKQANDGNLIYENWIKRKNNASYGKALENITKGMLERIKNPSDIIDIMVYYELVRNSMYDKPQNADRYGFLGAEISKKIDGRLTALSES